jgi:hypothetical protein
VRPDNSTSTTGFSDPTGALLPLESEKIISDLPPKSRNHAKPLVASNPKFFPIEKIVSGGQTGVDRAALDAAIALELPHGGWCPLGRIAEDGPIPHHYQLQEHFSSKYSDRTKQNVLDSNGTLVLYRWDLEGGTLKTFSYAVGLNKPCIRVRLTHPGRLERIRDWIVANDVRVLNVAGPRASKEPEIHKMAFEYLMKLLAS